MSVGAAEKTMTAHDRVILIGKSTLESNVKSTMSLFAL